MPATHKTLNTLHLICSAVLLSTGTNLQHMDSVKFFRCI